CAEGAVIDAGPGFAVEPPYVIGGLMVEPPGGGISGGFPGGICTGPDCPPPRSPPIDIAINKIAGNVRFIETFGQWFVDFKLDVTNVGRPFTPWNSIGISDPVPPGLTYLGATGANCTCALQMRHG